MGVFMQTEVEIKKESFKESDIGLRVAKKEATSIQKIGAGTKVADIKSVPKKSMAVEYPLSSACLLLVLLSIVLAAHALFYDYSPAKDTVKK